MFFTHEVLGGPYSLDTQIRFESQLKFWFMKLSKSGKTYPPFKRKSGSSFPSTMKSDTVREGAVRVEECRVHPKNWFFKIKWLALSETQLGLYRSQKTALRSSILLSDIAKLERTPFVPCGIILQTKTRRRYLLTFENDNDLYDWQDEISQRSPGVGLPYNFVHETHAYFNPTSGKIMGLPHGWDEILCNEYDHEHAEFQISLVIRGPTSKLVYVWAARSLAETMQDILESVCHKMGLDPADYILVIPGDNAPLEGTVSDLHGNRELAMVKRKPTGVGKVSTSTQSHLEVVYLRINLESLPNATHCSTTVAVTPLMQIQDVLNLVCWRTKAPAPGYTLGLAGGVQPLAMDRTVASLQGDRNLILIESAPRLINEASERVNLGASEHINLRISSDGGGLTNVSAAPQMQIQEVLELICWRRTIKASEYTLALAGSEQSLSLDCDVTSLEGKRDLVLVKRPCIPPTATSPSLQLRMFTDDRKFTDDSVAPEMHNVPAANGTVADLEGNRDLVLVNRARPLPRSVLLRINLRISPDEPHLTDISVSPTIQIENVLKHVCWKLKFQVTEYTLALTGGVEPLAMARTVADLGKSHELVLVKRRD